MKDMKVDYIWLKAIQPLNQFNSCSFGTKPNPVSDSSV